MTQTARRDPPPFHIVFALFPGVTHLDFTGPHQILCRLPGAQVVVASRAGGEVEADGLVFANDMSTVLLGRLNKVVKAPAGANVGRAYQGPVGYVIE